MIEGNVINFDTLTQYSFIICKNFRVVIFLKKITILRKINFGRMEYNFKIAINNDKACCFIQSLGNTGE